MNPFMLISVMPLWMSPDKKKETRRKKNWSLIPMIRGRMQSQDNVTKAKSECLTTQTMERIELIVKSYEDRDRVQIRRAIQKRNSFYL